jgi:hypothetical protein
MSMGGLGGINTSSGPGGSHMIMGGRNGIDLSSGSGGGNNVPGTMVRWNSNVNFGNIGYSNGWPGQVGWNNVNFGNIGNGMGNNHGSINSGLVNGRHPSTMIG